MIQVIRELNNDPIGEILCHVALQGVATRLVVAATHRSADMMGLRSMQEDSMLSEGLEGAGWWSYSGGRCACAC